MNAEKLKGTLHELRRERMLCNLSPPTDVYMHPEQLADWMFTIGAEDVGLIWRPGMEPATYTWQGVVLRCSVNVPEGMILCFSGREIIWRVDACP